MQTSIAAKLNIRPELNVRPLMYVSEVCPPKLTAARGQDSVARWGSGWQLISQMENAADGASLNIITCKATGLKSTCRSYSIESVENGDILRIMRMVELNLRCQEHPGFSQIWAIIEDEEGINIFFEAEKMDIYSYYAEGKRSDSLTEEYAATKIILPLLQTIEYMHAEQAVIHVRRRPWLELPVGTSFLMALFSTTLSALCFCVFNTIRHLELECVRSTSNLLKTHPPHHFLRMYPTPTPHSDASPPRVSSSTMRASSSSATSPSPSASTTSTRAPSWAACPTWLPSCSSRCSSSRRRAPRRWQRTRMTSGSISGPSASSCTRWVGIPFVYLEIYTSFQRWIVYLYAHLYVTLL